MKGPWADDDDDDEGGAAPPKPPPATGVGRAGVCEPTMADPGVIPTSGDAPG
jgi:hypothetical protein